MDLHLALPDQTRPRDFLDSDLKELEGQCETWWRGGRGCWSEEGEEGKERVGEPIGRETDDERGELRVRGQSQT